MFSVPLHLPAHTLKSAKTLRVVFQAQGGKTLTQAVTETYFSALIIMKLNKEGLSEMF